eukprot:jgi/Botrbrau1/13752/Bobra.0056s0009.1
MRPVLQKAMGRLKEAQGEVGALTKEAANLRKEVEGLRHSLAVAHRGAAREGGLSPARPQETPQEGEGSFQGIMARFASGPKSWPEMQAKVEALEDANKKLEEALNAAASHALQVPSQLLGPQPVLAVSSVPQEDGAVRQLQATLAARDAQIGALQAQLMDVAYPGNPPQDDGPPDATSELLRKDIADLKASLAKQDALLNAIKEAARGKETELQEMKAALADLLEVLGLPPSTAELPRAALTSIQTHWSELKVLLETARRDAAAAQGALHKLQTSTALKSAHERAQGGQMLSETQTALELAVTQAREGEKAVVQMKRREASRDLEQQRARWEQAVRRAREDGCVRLAAMEDSLRCLGTRSDLHQEVSRLALEAVSLKRSEAQLRLDLDFAEGCAMKADADLRAALSRIGLLEDLLVSATMSTVTASGGTDAPDTAVLPINTAATAPKFAFVGSNSSAGAPAHVVGRSIPPQELATPPGFVQTCPVREGYADLPDPKGTGSQLTISTTNNIIIFTSTTTGYNHIIIKRKLLRL